MGWDVLRGDKGADVLHAADGHDNDVVDGGQGADDCTMVDPGDQLLDC